MSEWIAEHPFLGSLILWIIMGGIIAGSFWQNDQEDRRQLECMSEWGQEVTERSDALSLANNTREQSLDELVRSVQFIQQDRELFEEKLRAYVKASDNSQEVQADNPVPDSPMLTCTNLE
jgi:hypothetical protein